ncbi:hypothetical protein BV20DRAFT_967858 [Pilatotrama ljubarskyi]|nr:hypothetical protein BV20DRAFT_967858 [Pilatotrama ljubarskyi]
MWMSLSLLEFTKSRLERECRLAKPLEQEESGVEARGLMREVVLVQAALRSGERAVRIAESDADLPQVDMTRSCGGSRSSGELRGHAGRDAATGSSRKLEDHRRKV